VRLFCVLLRPPACAICPTKWILLASPRRLLYPLSFPIGTVGPDAGCLFSATPSALGFSSHLFRGVVKRARVEALGSGSVYRSLL
jgi:hypothetical protein